MADKETIYHEKQSYGLCLVHSMNNFLGRKAISKADCDQCCTELSNDLINPHRNMFGLGNYDVNILQMIAGKNNLETK